MKQDIHVAHFRESLEALETALDRGLAARQRSVGFHASSAAIDLLSIYLFREKLITPGTQIQHQWFRSSKRAHEKLPFEFPEKSRILALLQAIETARDPFSYGAIQSVEEIRRVFTLFQELRAVFRTLGVTPDEG